MPSYFYSPTKQKILFLLATGLVLGFSPSPSVHIRMWKKLPKVWREIDRLVLRRIIKEFKYKRLVDFHDNKDGTVTVVLTELGRKHAIRYNPEKVSVAIPARWDKKWRIVVFDIPEKKKAAREAFRTELKKLGFAELQKSTWIFPYHCRDAIDFFIELFEIRDHVRYLDVVRMSYDADLRLQFGLS